MQKYIEEYERDHQPSLQPNSVEVLNDTILDVFKEKDLLYIQCLIVLSDCDRFVKTNTRNFKMVYRIFIDMMDIYDKKQMLIGKELENISKRLQGLFLKKDKIEKPKAPSTILTCQEGLLENFTKFEFHAIKVIQLHSSAVQKRRGLLEKQLKRDDRMFKFWLGLFFVGTVYFYLKSKYTPVQK